MKIYVPYTKIQPATAICLKGYNFAAVECKGSHGYFEYMQDRWEEGQSFINIEHDTVFWPGSLEAIRDCAQPWCAYGFAISDDFSKEGCVYLSMAKISKDMIKQLPDVWQEPKNWQVLDCHLTNYAKEHGLTVHQHYPSIVNANPKLLT